MYTYNAPVFYDLAKKLCITTSVMCDYHCLLMKFIGSNLQHLLIVSNLPTQADKYLFVLFACTRTHMSSEEC